MRLGRQRTASHGHASKSGDQRGGATMAHDVFICHSDSDAALAATVCDALEHAGITCWVAPRDVAPGARYAGQLTAAIETSRLVLLILSAKAIASHWVLSEIEIATNRRIPILPFRIEDVAPTGDMEIYIRALQWFDAITPPIEARVGALVDCV
ncbi:MAG TPA: toll/interleukin-1 receptor domain-containing protein, partial [Candidatus Limnocylindrales bacterium]|nr:toll/interleukin-1 receptor domain-containing protein [Candidatus Limnocylindrales bacterium]